MEEKEKAPRRLQSVRMGREFTRRLYVGAREAKERGQKATWVMAWPAWPILHTFDIVYSPTENYGAFSAVKQVIQPLLQRAEGMGYAHDLCGYIKNAIVYPLMEKEFGGPPPDAPDGGPVKPDFLISQSNTCDPRVTHYRAVAQHWDIPLYGYDFNTPQYSADREEIENCIRYNAEEYRGLIAFLEKQTGRKMDWDKFDEAMQTDYKSRQLFQEIQLLRKAVPSPMSTRDNIAVIVVWYWFTCDPACVEYLTKVRDEVKEWVDNKIGYLPEEKYRIFWLGGIPPYHTLELYRYFDGYGAASAFETNNQFYKESEERKDPLENLASRLMSTHMADQGGVYFDQDWIRSIVDGYSIDGIVAHQIMGCRQTTVGVKACIEKLREYKEMPALFIPGDQVDMRDYSDPNTRANMANFIDALATSKERRK